MTDQQFQPGQTTPPTQNAGVFGGNGDDSIKNVTMFEPFGTSTQESVNQEPEFTLSHDDIVPFGGNNAAESTPSYESPTIAPETAPTTEVSQAPIKEEITNTEPVVTPIVKENPEESLPVVSEPTAMPVVEDTIEKPTEPKISDIQQKVSSLEENLNTIRNTLDLKDTDLVEIVGANNDKLSLIYQFSINEEKAIAIKRIETEKDTDEHNFSELKLAMDTDTKLLQVFLDNILLFEETELIEDPKKKSQVMEKLNKFVFLTESKLKDIQKDLKAKEEEEKERRRLQDIFRNF